MPSRRHSICRAARRSRSISIERPARRILVSVSCTATRFLPAGWLRTDEGPYSSEGLGLAPWSNNRVGVRASYAYVQRLVARYGADAAQTYFPYPRLLEPAPSGNLFQRRLVMVFTREALGKAAAIARADSHASH